MVPRKNRLEGRVLRAASANDSGTAVCLVDLSGQVVA
jgi:hypothetical protein